MSEIRNIKGQRFNELVAVDFSHTDRRGHAYWLCKCDCGNTSVVRVDALTTSNTHSCGCKNARVARETMIMLNTRHGDSRTRLYHIWGGMHYRCSSTGWEGSANYAKRGIRVCDEWKNYIPFRDWALQNGYSDTLTLDRIDVNGNYEPSNCRWATWEEQRKNKRDSIYLTLNGERHHLTEWAEITGVQYATLHRRWKKGENPERVLRPLHDSINIHDELRKAGR